MNNAGLDSIVSILIEIKPKVQVQQEPEPTIEANPSPPVVADADPFADLLDLGAITPMTVPEDPAQQKEIDDLEAELSSL